MKTSWDLKRPRLTVVRNHRHMWGSCQTLHIKKLHQLPKSVLLCLKNGFKNLTNVLTLFKPLTTPWPSNQFNDEAWAKSCIFAAYQSVCNSVILFPVFRRTEWLVTYHFLGKVSTLVTEHYVRFCTDGDTAILIIITTMNWGCMSSDTYWSWDMRICYFWL